MSPRDSCKNINGRVRACQERAVIFWPMPMRVSSRMELRRAILEGVREIGCSGSAGKCGASNDVEEGVYPMEQHAQELDGQDQTEDDQEHQAWGKTFMHIMHSISFRWDLYSAHLKHWCQPH